MDYPTGLSHRLGSLVRTLDELGYRFTDPDLALPGPAPSVDTDLAKLARLVGPVPRMLAAFYREVGSVDLRGAHHAWTGCDYPDPLVIDPIAVALEEAVEFAALSDPKTEYWASDSGVFRVPISPDPLHKADVSGGMWYGIEIPNASDDPVVLEEAHGLALTQYLAFALSWGGFPGLEGCPAHTYPLAQLRAAAAASG